MEINAAEASAFVGSLMWPFMRISAMLMAIPVIGTRMVSTRIRVVLAVLISFVVVPLIPQVPAVDPLSLAGLTISLHQVLIGLAMGFVLQMVLATLTIAGEVISMTMGLGFASMVDPANGVNVPVLSQFFLIMGTLMFLALGGHLMIIQLVVNSFQTLPVSVDGISRESFWVIIKFGSEMFIGAAWIALPAVISILTITLAMGVVTRAAPQLNIFSIGFPVTMLVGFIILMLVMPSILPRFNQILLQGMQLSQKIGGL
ncbi:MAG: flagellar biosynthetic protein FliR [Gammaproteobacteria bacterium]|nr:flagellar biosynthetic protein FliR [Gammaproteobacteria bacterium]